MLIQNEDDFGRGISLPEADPPAECSRSSQVTEVRYGYVPLAPREIVARPDALHRTVPPAHMFRRMREQNAEAEQFGTSLYFG